MPRKAPPEDKILNPATGRYVLKTGAIGKKILAGMKEGEMPVQADEKILNPATGRYVLKRGAIGKKILAQMAAAAKPAPAPAPKQMKTPEEAKQILTRAIASKKAKTTFNETKEIEKIYDKIFDSFLEKGRYKQFFKDYLYYTFKSSSTTGSIKDEQARSFSYDGTKKNRDDDTMYYYNKILNELYPIKDLYDKDMSQFILEYFKAAIDYWYFYHLSGIKKDSIKIDLSLINTSQLNTKTISENLNKLFKVNYPYNNDDKNYEDKIEEIFKMYLKVFYDKIFKPNIITINEIIIKSFKTYDEYNKLYYQFIKTYDTNDPYNQILVVRDLIRQTRENRFKETNYDSGADTDEENDIIEAKIKNDYEIIMFNIERQIPDEVFSKWFDKYKPRNIKTIYFDYNQNYQNFKKIIIFILYHIKKSNKEIIDNIFHKVIIKRYRYLEDFNSSDGFRLLMNWFGINLNNLRQYGDMRTAQRELFNKAITKFKKDNQENDYMSFFKREVMNYVIDKYKK